MAREEELISLRESNSSNSQGTHAVAIATKITGYFVYSLLLLRCSPLSPDFFCLSVVAIFHMARKPEILEISSFITSIFVN